MTTEPASPVRSPLSRLFDRFRRTAALWSRHDGGVLSAAVAYYAALSALPLILLAFLTIEAISQHVGIAENVNLHDVVLQAVEDETSPQLRAAIETTLSATRADNSVSGPLVLGWLAATSILVFAQIDRGIARIWRDGDDRDDRGLLRAVWNTVTNRARAVLMLLALGFVLSVMFVTTLIFESLESVRDLAPVVGGVYFGTHFLLNTVFFGLLMKWFARKPLWWWDAFHGAALLALSWEVGRVVVAAFVVRNHSNLYGVIGSFLVILLWIYYVSLLLFFWASYVKCLADERPRPTSAE